MATKKAKEITFEKAVPAFLQYLKDEGKNERTVEVYGRCLDNVTAYFGADKPLEKLTPATIGTFFKSDALLKKPNGKAKSEITVVQNKRVFRMMLVWAQEKGYLSEVPLPKSEMKGDKKKDGNNTGDNEPTDTAQGN
ncbi:MAG: hypothetical protein WCS96_06260 [Victivallales bacterium]